MSSKGGNTSTVPRLATAWCGAAPAVSGRRMSTTNTIAAILAVGEFCVQLATSLLLADAFAANTIVHSAKSQQQCSSGRDLPANTSVHAAITWQVVSAMPALPTPQLVPSTWGNNFPWLMPTLITLQLLLVPRPTSMPPTTQRLSPPTPPTLIPWPNPLLPLPQQVSHTVGNSTPQPVPFLPTRLLHGNGTCQLCRPMLSPALLPPVIAVLQQAPRVHSIHACIASRQAWPHVAVAMQSWIQARQILRW